MAYDLFLSVDPDQPRFSGEVRIALEVDTEVEAIHLHARNLELHRCELRRPDGRVDTATVAPAEDARAEPAYGEIAVSIGGLIERGPAELYFAFEGDFDPQMAGLYRVRDQDRWYAFTQFEAADARKAFPCFDEPGFKAPFRLTLEVPEGQTAVSNGPEAERTAAGGRVRVAFRETPPMPTYLLALAVGPLEVVEGLPHRVPLRLLVPRGRAPLAAPANEMLPGILDALEAWFGIPYPYEKLDLVAVPEFAAGAMENAGLVTFREELLLADPKAVSESRRRVIAEVIAHEVAHHWFGNLVTMHWWEDLWLNEAFATWMAAKAVDAWRPEFEPFLDLLQTRSGVMETDALPAARKIRQEVGGVGEAEQAFDALTYQKGAAVLTMLERWIGADAFQAGVRAYLGHHSWGNATAADLFGALDEASGQDVSGVAASYLNQPGLPLVEVAPTDGEVTLSQRPFALLGLDAPVSRDARWQIPVRLGTTWHVLQDETAVVPAPGGPGHPNLGEWSYYRWALPEADLVALARAEDLDVRSRLGVLENAWGMVSAGTLTPAAYLDVLESQAPRTERPLVEEVVAGLGRIHDLWAEVWETPAWTATVDRLLSPHLARIGFEPAEGEPADHTLLRPRLLQALGYLGRHRPTLDRARTLAAQALASPGSLSPELARSVLTLAAWDGAVARTDLVTVLTRTQDPEPRLAALAALAMLPPGPELEAALEHTVDGTIRAQDFRYLFRGAMGRPEARDQAFAWFKRRFAEVKARQSEFTFVHIGGHVGDFRTEAGRDDARAFFEAQKVPGGDRAVRQGTQRADHAIALKNRGREALDAWLAAHAG